MDIITILQRTWTPKLLGPQRKGFILYAIQKALSKITLPIFTIKSIKNFNNM